MKLLNSLVRQAMLAALLLLPTQGKAEVRAIYDTTRDALLISGLAGEQREGLLKDPSNVFLQHGDLPNMGSMALSLTASQGNLVILPRFKLRQGADYILRLDLGGSDRFTTTVSAPAVQSASPDLVWHAPDGNQIPENTLRLYLMFSEPMARGQARETIWLERADGSLVDSPFLNLGAELWDREQRRLTVLFDPGRIKQGIGPNQTDGAPLQTGLDYVLVLSGKMKSAAGVSMDAEKRIPFRIGAAERRALAPEHWQIRSAAPGTTDALEVRFDRLMDRGAAARLLSVLDAAGKTVPGRIENRGHLWRFTPDTPWRKGAKLRVDPGLEDVSGNTIRAPFDAKTGTMGRHTEAVELEIY